MRSERGNNFIGSIVEAFKPNLEVFVNFPGAYAGSRKFVDGREELFINSDAVELQADIEIKPTF